MVIPGLAFLVFSIASAFDDVSISVSLTATWDHAQRGAALAKIGRVEQAIEEFGRAIDTDPEDVRLYSARAQLWFTREKFGRAIDDCTRAISLDPENPQHHYARGVARLKQREFENAIADLTESIRRAPEHALSYHYRGYALGKLKSYDEALADFDRAIEFDDGNAESYYFRGMVRAAQEDIGRAIADVSRAIELDGKPEYYEQRATLWKRQGESKKNITDAMFAVASGTKNAESYVAVADYHYSQEKYDEAVKQYQTALRINERNFRVLYKLASLLATCPDSDVRDGLKAIEHATAACELTDWENFSAIEVLAAAYAETGKFDRAIEWQNRVLEMAPDWYREESAGRLKLYRENRPMRSEILP